MGFRQETYRSNVPFLLHYIKSTCCQQNLSPLMLTFITWLRYCSSGFLTVKLLIPTLNPLKCSLWKVVTKHSQPILKEGRVMLYLSKMKYMHKLFGMVFLNTILLENFWCWILSPNSLNWSHILFFKNMIYNLKIRSNQIFHLNFWNIVIEKDTTGKKKP